jgi:predicted helicase
MDFSLKAEKKSIIAFITNYAFIGTRSYDGFRRELRDTFKYAQVINLGGDMRNSGGENIFPITVGVGISFYEPKRGNGNSFELYYTQPLEDTTRDEKIEFLSNYDRDDFIYTPVIPDEKENWLNQSDSDFLNFFSLCSKDAKFNKDKEMSISQLFTLGICTNRNDWAYDFSIQSLFDKMQYFTNEYNDDVKKWVKHKKNIKITDFVSRTIKYTEELEWAVEKGYKIEFKQEKIIKSYFRPFVMMYTYFDEYISHRRYRTVDIFGNTGNLPNDLIGFQYGRRLDFSCISTNVIPNLDTFSLGPAVWVPYYRYEKDKKIDNITDWALAEFQNHYKDKKITKEDIFHYVYAVLHNPVYREKYAIDLKQDYPRIPFYRDFKKWAAWGKELMDLHISFEKIAPHKGITVIPAPADYRETKTHRVDYTKDEQGEKVFSGSLTFCDGSGLKGIPPRAFDYKLGNKSAIEWVLDQYIAPSWPTDAEVASGKRKIREDEKVLRDKFSTFRFDDYREKVIDLIRRLATVSLRTLEIQGMMREENR